MGAWFAAANASLLPVPLPPTRSGLDFVVYRLPANESGEGPSPPAGAQDRIVVVVRGTASARDISHDGLLWQEAITWGMLSLVGPFYSWPVVVGQTFLRILGGGYEAAGLIMAPGHEVPAVGGGDKQHIGRRS